VYHYNHYEPTSVDHLTELHETRQEAVGRLMGRFATREDEVDGLFRLGVFVDLYRVVRQGIRAGRGELFDQAAGAAVRIHPADGSAARRPRNLIAFEAALEDGGARGRLRAAKQIIAAYNEDDCRSALALRDWLEELTRGTGHAAWARTFRAPLPRRRRRSTEDPEVTRISSALMAGIPADPVRRARSEEKAKALLADLLDWHRREAKPAWWRYFYVRTLSVTDLIGEPDALGGLAGGEIVGEVKKSVVRRFSFPPQEYRFSAGDAADRSGF
jgi:hypothetical protein